MVIVKGHDFIPNHYYILSRNTKTRKAFILFKIIKENNTYEGEGSFIIKPYKASGEFGWSYPPNKDGIVSFTIRGALGTRCTKVLKLDKDEVSAWLL